MTYPRQIQQISDPIRTCVVCLLRLRASMGPAAGHFEIVQRLVASGKVDVNAVNGRGDSALHKVRNTCNSFSPIMDGTQSRSMSSLFGWTGIGFFFGALSHSLHSLSHSPAFPAYRSSSLHPSCSPFCILPISSNLFLEATSTDIIHAHVGRPQTH